MTAASVPYGLGRAVPSVLERFPGPARTVPRPSAPVGRRGGWGRIAFRRRLSWDDWGSREELGGL